MSPSLIWVADVSPVVLSAPWGQTQWCIDEGHRIEPKRSCGCEFRLQSLGGIGSFLGILGKPDLFLSNCPCLEDDIISLIISLCSINIGAYCLKSPTKPLAYGQLHKSLLLNNSGPFSSIVRNPGLLLPVGTHIRAFSPFSHSGESLNCFQPLACPLLIEKNSFFLSS